MRYGELLKELVDKNGLSKSGLCSSLGISRPYLYAVFSGTTPPPVPEKQKKIASLLPITNEEKSALFDLAASERGELPADIVDYASDEHFRRIIRELYIYSDRQDVEPTQEFQTISKKRVTSSNSLRVPCCYQGGKQRIAADIVDSIVSSGVHIDSQTHFFDLCCGSGAFSIELLNRGVSPSQITMLDISSWGVFWESIGSGTFNLDKLHCYLDQIPSDKRAIKDYMTSLSKLDIDDQDECYVYIILQSCSFGGKQIWREGNEWKNAFFRSYWEPTASSVRRSPANPMQPSPRTLEKRISSLIENCRGIECLNDDVSAILSFNVPDDAVIYLDPPYRGTTGYAFGFDVDKFLSALRRHTNASIFVSDSVPLSNQSTHLHLGGANGGISGSRSKKHQEWLSQIA